MMQSLQSRLIIGLIRNRSRERVDGNFSLSRFREKVDRVSRKMKLPAKVRSEKTDLGGIPGEWLIPDNHRPGKILMYIHGGGFVSGSCLTHRMHVAKFARASGMKSLVFDYRLAPEHPFPAALEDCLAVYRALSERVSSPEDLCVGGESAGGTLALSLLLALKERRLPLPGRVFAVSPLTDFHCTADSFTRNVDRDIALPDSWHLWGDYYRNGHDPSDPLLSPLFGDFSGTVPLLLTVGTDEVHYDDVKALADRMGEKGGLVTLSEWPGMVHAFPVLAPFFPEATRALGEIGDFLRQ